MSEFLIKKIENFDLNKGELEIEYVLCRQYKNWRGRKKLQPVYQYHPEAGRRAITGDLDWAKRVAKFYELPNPSTNNKEQS